jgi:hypothetical protein
LTPLIPALMLCVRDRTLPVKLASERALVYVLKVKESGDTLLTKFLGTVDASVLPPGLSVRSISDYVKRVITKIAATESDEETEDV